MDTFYFLAPAFVLLFLFFFSFNSGICQLFTGFCVNPWKIFPKEEQCHFFYIFGKIALQGFVIQLCGFLWLSLVVTFLCTPSAVSECRSPWGNFVATNLVPAAGKSSWKELNLPISFGDIGNPAFDAGGVSGQSMQWGCYPLCVGARVENRSLGHRGSKGDLYFLPRHVHSHSSWRLGYFLLPGVRAERMGGDLPQEVSSSSLQPPPSPQRPWILLHSEDWGQWSRALSSSPNTSSPIPIYAHSHRHHFFSGEAVVFLLFRVKLFSYDLDLVPFYLLTTLLCQSFSLSYIFLCLHS